MLILLEAVEGELCILVNSLYQSIIFRLLVILLCICLLYTSSPSLAAPAVWLLDGPTITGPIMSKTP